MREELCTPFHLPRQLQPVRQIRHQTIVSCNAPDSTLITVRTDPGLWVTFILAANCWHMSRVSSAIGTGPNYGTM